MNRYGESNQQVQESSIWKHCTDPFLSSIWTFYASIKFPASWLPLYLTYSRIDANQTGLDLGR